MTSAAPQSVQQIAYNQKMMVLGSKPQTSPTSHKPNIVMSSPKTSPNSSNMYLVQTSGSTKQLAGLKGSPKNQ
jgi:hypothetical protein